MSCYFATGIELVTETSVSGLVPPVAILATAGDEAPSMDRQLPPLPEGFSWRTSTEGVGELTLWGLTVVARIESSPMGWVSRVNLCFHESLHRKAIAGSKRQACHWVHRWVAAHAERLCRARPESCVLVVPTTLG